MLLLRNFKKMLQMASTRSQVAKQSLRKPKGVTGSHRKPHGPTDSQGNQGETEVTRGIGFQKIISLVSLVFCYVLKVFLCFYKATLKKRQFFQWEILTKVKEILKKTQPSTPWLPVGSQLQPASSSQPAPASQLQPASSSQPATAIQLQSANFLRKLLIFLRIPFTVVRVSLWKKERFFSFCLVKPKEKLSQWS